jgi:Putative periplasmic protein kinase ArgK and related GTPases of G3E family
MRESQLAEAVIRGEVRAAARLMRDIDDEIPSAREELKALFPYTGRAHIVGITGSPGTGKSTLVDHIIQSYRQRKRTVGVVAVGPHQSLHRWGPFWGTGSACSATARTRVSS